MTADKFVSDNESTVPVKNVEVKGELNPENKMA